MYGGGKVGPRSYFMGEDLNFISVLLDSNLFNTVNISCTVHNATEVRYQAKTDRSVRQGKERGPSSYRTMDALFLVSRKC